MRLLRFALRNISRSLLLSISSIVVISLMTFLIFVMFLVEYVLHSLASNVNSRLSLVLHVRQEYSETSKEVVDVLRTFSSISQDVDASYSSSKDNLETMRLRDPELAKIIETDDENPLPSTITIKNVPIDVYDKLNAAILLNSAMFDLDEKKQRETAISYKGQYERLQSVVTVLNGLRYGLFAIILFFLCSVFIVIYHSIGNAVFFFREEIRITELVGGMRRYIYGPFMLQGAIYSIVACTVSSFLFYSVALNARIDVIIGSAYSIDTFLANSGQYMLLTILSVMFLGGASALVAAWRFVK